LDTGGGKEWQGLWDKGVFKKWSRKDLLSNDRVFTSRYVYKLKRSAVTGEVYRFKARLIVRGFQMEKGVDFDDSFSPTPGLAVGRFMLSLAVANDYELHACDIEQAFLQADKLPEGVNGRYFIQPPPGSPTRITEMSCTRFAALFMVTPLHHALCTRPWTPIL
jgi:Reverse transcriptase (RNA-dependent DNA polymerase).